ncbi:hypothetical protein H5410_049161 [Solanum commersonii]|uniref:Rhodopsin n=1 Tax=Solanum commersonii TaxID=4109 RepID=A0A9J5XMN0_SOLCO|nr:hypothetical protein H5410_049161 [Solanum commersonii]
MSYYNQQQPPVGVPPPQGYPPEGYSKDAYPPPGYPQQGYPPQGYPQQGYPPPQYAPQYGAPPPQQHQQQSSSTGLMQGCCVVELYGCVTVGFDISILVWLLCAVAVCWMHAFEAVNDLCHLLMAKVD